MKFGYTLLYVKDVEASVLFYESAFGISRSFVHESGYGEMNTGETKLGFVAESLAASNGVEFAAVQGTAKPPGVEIAFVTENVASAYEKAVNAGATVAAPPKQKPWGQTVAYVRDCNGFLVEICSPVSG